MRALFAAALLVPVAASALSGFYVSNAGVPLFNDASRVVLMRDGTRTVLSMQSDYRGPPETVALVVPVPVLLKKDQVRVLPREVFERIDTLTAPRLVEELEPGICPKVTAATNVHLEPSAASSLPRDLGVKVEAKFEVGEYDVAILSAKDALGLDGWLKDNKYAVAPNAAPLLKPYVDANWKFFVAKVNAKKLTFAADGRAVLSPLRFHYDSDSFTLPVRLGLMNSPGTQDLVVTVIAKQRYELANLKNVRVPTNIRLKPAGEPEFPALYAELLKRTFAKYPTAAITELAWEGALPPPKVLTPMGIYGMTCDPCPSPQPVDDALAKYLGAEVMPGVKTDVDIAMFAHATTVTRLHLRYAKDALNSDLVFKAAEPLAGGTPDALKPTPAPVNRFQGRYIVHKPFDASRCSSAGWNGSTGAISITATGLNAKPAALTQPIEELLLSDVPELGLKATRADP